MKPIVWIAIVCLSGIAHGQRVSADIALRANDKSYIEATGEATITAKPDIAVIDIGVVSQGRTAADASALNAKQTASFLDEVRKLLGAEDQVKTVSLSIRPDYQTPKPGSTPAITGYTATNVVEVTLQRVDQVGKIVDTSVQSGANTIQRIQFRLKDEQAARAKALTEASAKAKASAEAIAAGLGVRLVRLLSAQEGGSDEGIGMQKRSFAVPAGAAPTQVEAGTIEVTATITVRFEVGQD